MSNTPAAPRQKAPLRTAERILDVALDLFNRYGEPGTSTAMIAAELRISPGNLYYHYPAKEALVNALVERFEGAMQQALPRAATVSSLDDACAFISLLFEQIWQHRFLYRDLNDLLTRNRPLEQHHNRMRELQHEALRLLLERLQQAGALRPAATEQRAQLATTLLLVLTYWLSHEYAGQPRSALEPDNQARAITRGVAQVRSLLELLRPC
jgi:AcrR family transcriptional regulator